MRSAKKCVFPFRVSTNDQRKGRSQRQLRTLCEPGVVLLAGRIHFGSGWGVRFGVGRSRVFWLLALGCSVAVLGCFRGLVVLTSDLAQGSVSGLIDQGVVTGRQNKAQLNLWLVEGLHGKPWPKTPVAFLQLVRENICNRYTTRT